MSEIIALEFQQHVDEVLSRHRGILDILSKYQDTTARVNRSTIKAATSCGCVRYEGGRQLPVSDDLTLDEMHSLMRSQIAGELCPACRDVIEKELGANLFYIASLCNALGLSIYDILLKEENRLDTLGQFNLR